MKHPKDRPVHPASHERPTGRRQWMCLCLLLLFTTAVRANDGSYFTTGNQLLPLVESDIRVQREILTLSWGDDGTADVDVYYEFFNPGAQKSILMGFEADPPSYMDTLDRSGAHPYISDFTVAMNGKPLAVATSIVRSDTLYLDAGAVDAGMYATLQREVFDKRCAHCHGGAGTAAGGLDLTEGRSYAALVGQPSLSVPDSTRVLPGNTAASILHQILLPEEVLGLPVTHGDLLSSTERRLIDEWIDAGARE